MKNRIFGFGGIVLPVTILVTLFSCSQPAANSPSASRQEMVSYMESAMKQQQIPGLAYAIVYNNKIVDSGALGFANVEHQVPVTLQSRFNIGSIAKTFTATAIMMLQKEGKLSIQDPIHQYLDSLPESWKKITIQQLVSHTSGLRDYCEDFPGYPLLGGRTGEGLEERMQELTSSQFIRMAGQDPLNFPPGERWAYSNTNYFLLGFILQKVSGQSLEELMQTRIFSPLGMTATRRESAREIIPNRASGYILNDSNQLIHGAYISNFYSTQGDMGIITTATDLARWSMALDEGKILDKETLQQMWTPAQLNNGLDAMFLAGGYSYGLGWFLSNHNGFTVVAHDGNFMNGYSAQLMRFPEKKLAIVILTNLQPWKIRQPGIDVYKIASYYEPGLKSFDQFQADDSADSSLNQKVKALYASWMTGNFDTDSTLVSKALKARINPIVKVLFDGSAPVPAPSLQVQCIKSEQHSGQLMRWGVPVTKIYYYKVQEGDQPPRYLSVYYTADNAIADVEM